MNPRIFWQLHRFITTDNAIEGILATFDRARSKATRISGLALKALVHAEKEPFGVVMDVEAQTPKSIKIHIDSYERARGVANLNIPQRSILEFPRFPSNSPAPGAGKKPLSIPHITCTGRSRRAWGEAFASLHPSSSSSSSATTLLYMLIVCM